MSIDLSNYVEVSERITMFREKYPDGTFQTEIVSLPDAFAAGFIAVRAYAYRTPDDQRPGVDLAWEPVPGKTPYTKDSELMNACTSAIGRAIIAVGAADTKRGIASANEVRNRDYSDVPPEPPPDPAVAELRDFMASVRDLDEATRQAMNAWWQARDPSTSSSELLAAGRAVLAQALADSMQGVDDEKPPDPEITVTPEVVEERTTAGVCVGCGKPFAKSGKHVQDVGDPLYGASCSPF